MGPSSPSSSAMERIVIEDAKETRQYQLTFEVIRSRQYQLAPHTASVIKNGRADTNVEGLGSL